jgi:hypothetical protein
MYAGKDMKMESRVLGKPELGSGHLLGEIDLGSLVLEL